MKRLSRALLLSSTLAVAAPMVFPEVARAAVGDQRREVERIVDELDRLHTQADILAEDYAEAVDRKNQLDQEVAAAAERVAAKEAELNALRGDLAEVAVRSFTGGGADVLGPLFSDAASYSESLRRDQYSRVALSVGTVTTDDLDEFIDDLNDERDALAAKRREVEQLTVTINQKQEQTDELTDQYIARRQQAESRLGQLIEEEEQRRADEAFARLQAELAAQQAAAAAASNSSGGGGGTASGGGGTSTGGGTSSGTGDGGGSTSSGGSGGTSTPVPKPPPVTDYPAVSGLAGIAIDAALGQQGVAYKYATSKPGVSFDCSGLTHYAWGVAGVYLPRNSRAQAAATPRVPSAAAQPGDLIFYYSPISHVGIYLGGGRLVHAPNSGTVVKVANVSWGKVTAVGRPG
jgi:cell wall-associated NlpC family hydrolase